MEIQTDGAIHLVFQNIDASGNEIKYTADELDTGSIFYTIANKNISGSMAEGYNNYK